MRDEDKRDWITNAIRRLEDDELEVVRLVVMGLIGGRTVYGELVAGADDRDWAGEALEEIRDALVYVGAALVRARG